MWAGHGKVIAALATLGACAADHAQALQVHNVGAGTRSASAVVFANKAVFAKYGFHFTYTLTLIHTATTLVGMWLLSSVFGVFTAKPLPLRKVAPLAAAFVGELPLLVLSQRMSRVTSS